jgi:hypothetical protein
VVGVTFFTVVGVVRTVVTVVGTVVRSVVGVVRSRTVVVVVGSVVVVTPLVVVEGDVVTGTVVVTWAASAAYPTKIAEAAHDPRKIAWVT